MEIVMLDQKRSEVEASGERVYLSNIIFGIILKTKSINYH
jgi:hypothetical protein